MSITFNQRNKYVYNLINNFHVFIVFAEFQFSVQKLLIPFNRNVAYIKHSWKATIDLVCFHFLVKIVYSKCIIKTMLLFHTITFVLGILVVGVIGEVCKSCNEFIFFMNLKCYFIYLLNLAPSRFEYNEHTKSM